MKKLFFRLFLFAALVLVLNAGFTTKAAFLATAVDCTASATLVNGTDFDSLPLTTAMAPAGCLTVMFTTDGSGTASTIDFQFQGSYDGGTTWTTSYFVHVAVATNTTAASNVVRDATLVNLNGISHLRLYQIVSNDAANDLTSCNATLSY